MTSVPRLSLATTLSIAAGSLALLLCCLLPAGVDRAQAAPTNGARPAATRAAAKPPAVPKRHARPKPIYWGAWIGDQLTGVAPPWDMGGVGALEGLLGKGLSLVEFSSPFADCKVSPCSFYRFPAPAMENARRYGAIPFLSWGSQATPWDPVHPSQPDFQLADVAEGRHDDYLRKFASEAAAWGHPYFLRFNWEMNGDWMPWSEGLNGNSAGQFVAAWRHVHDIFTSVGATNATWVWCPYADPRERLAGLRGLYPGDSYVDWTCMDGYNWGKNPVNPQPWRSFGQIFDLTYKRLTQTVAPRKPIVIAEFASSPNGGHKAAWIRNMLAKLPVRYPRVRGLIWLDAFDRGVDWPLETSATASKAFATGIHKRVYQANRYAELAESPIKPPK
jgi:hypothetical protein